MTASITPQGRLFDALDLLVEPNFRSPRCIFMREAARLTTIADAIHQAHEAYVEAMHKKQLRTPLSERKQALLQESQEWVNEHKKTCPHVDSSQEGLAR